MIYDNTHTESVLTSEKISTQFQNIIKTQLLSTHERVIFESFQEYKEAYNSSYSSFQNLLDTTNGQFLYQQYPVCESQFSQTENHLNQIITSILSHYATDLPTLANKNMVSSAHVNIEDIELGAGDFHKGQSTAILELSNQQQLVYKPTSAHISKAYFHLVAWLSEKHKIRLGKYDILDKGQFHYLSFVNHKGCESKHEIKEYYKKAGATLCIAYVLNASDYHYENIIAHGSTPVLIDHETIIQPKVAARLNVYFKKIGDDNDSVLNTFLLPNKNDDGGMPIGTCGFGYHKQQEFLGLKKESLHPHTDDWNMVTRFVTEQLYKQNIPMLDGKRVYPIEYIEELLVGFQECYKLLMQEKEFLLSSKSPLQAFQESTVRFIWRPTNVYAKIQAKMKLPKNLKSAKQHRELVENYLKVAFKKVPAHSDLQNIYKSEVAQMLRGDIPFFEINASSRDLETEFGTVKNLFDLSCMENIERKLKKLSVPDCENQTKVIREAILG